MGSSKEHGDGVTVAGYWAEVTAMGLQKVRKVTPSNWIARDQNGDFIPIRDPEDMSPEQRRAILDDLFGTHVGVKH